MSSDQQNHQAVYSDEDSQYEQRQSILSAGHRNSLAMQNRLSKRHDHGQRPPHRNSYNVESIVEKEQGKTLKGEMNFHQTESHIINVDTEKSKVESNEQSTVERQSNLDYMNESQQPEQTVHEEMLQTMQSAASSHFQNLQQSHTFEQPEPQKNHQAQQSHGQSHQGHNNQDQSHTGQNNESAHPQDQQFRQRSLSSGSSRKNRKPSQAEQENNHGHSLGDELNPKEKEYAEENIVESFRDSGQYQRRNRLPGNSQVQYVDNYSGYEKKSQLEPSHQQAIRYQDRQQSENKQQNQDTQQNQDSQQHQDRQKNENQVKQQQEERQIEKSQASDQYPSRYQPVTEPQPVQTGPQLVQPLLESANTQREPISHLQPVNTQTQTQSVEQVQQIQTQNDNYPVQSQPQPKEYQQPERYLSYDQTPKEQHIQVQEEVPIIQQQPHHVEDQPHQNQSSEPFQQSQGTVTEQQSKEPQNQDQQPQTDHQQAYQVHNQVQAQQQQAQQHVQQPQQQSQPIQQIQQPGQYVEPVESVQQPVQQVHQPVRQVQDNEPSKNNDDLDFIPERWNRSVEPQIQNVQQNVEERTEYKDEGVQLVSETHEKPEENPTSQPIEQHVEVEQSSSQPTQHVQQEQSGQDYSYQIQQIQSQPTQQQPTQQIQPQQAEQVHPQHTRQNQPQSIHQQHQQQPKEQIPKQEVKPQSLPQPPLDDDLDFIPSRWGPTQSQPTEPTHQYQPHQPVVQEVELIQPPQIPQDNYESALESVKQSVQSHGSQKNHANENLSKQEQFLHTQTEQKISEIPPKNSHQSSVSHMDDPTIHIATSKIRTTSVPMGQVLDLSDSSGISKISPQGNHHYRDSSISPNQNLTNILSQVNNRNSEPVQLQPSLFANQRKPQVQASEYVVIDKNLSSLDIYGRSEYKQESQPQPVKQSLDEHRQSAGLNNPKSQDQEQPNLKKQEPNVPPSEQMLQSKDEMKNSVSNAGDLSVQELQKKTKQKRQKAGSKHQNVPEESSSCKCQIF